MYVARDCSLCGPALEVVRDVQAELGFELAIVEITGDADLEQAYRERLPVVEIGGAAAFTHFVEPDALRAAVRR